MASDGQGLYSFLTRREVGEKMMKQIEQISEVFSVSKSDATAILIRVEWNLFQASDRLGDNKEKFLAELGLDSSEEKESASSGADPETHSDGDGDDESQLLKSFVKGNNETIKWCPGPGCGYAIERDDDVSGDDDDESSLGFGVVCVCGHTLCWSCGQESHRPVSCKVASSWLEGQLGVFKNEAWVSENTRPCPRCNSPVQRIGDPDYRILTCVCSCSFCWRCFRSEEEHNRKWNCAIVATEPTHIPYLRLWEAVEKDVEKSKSEFEAFEENGIASLSGQETSALREARLLLVQCRLVLMWSCVLEYNIPANQSIKKQYVKHLRGEATTTLARHDVTLQELTNQALSSADFSFFKLKLSTSTTSTGDYFHQFVKTLEDDFA